MLDKKKMADILEKQVDDAIKELPKMKISESAYAGFVVNIIEVDKTVAQLKDQDAFDKAQEVKEIEKIMDDKESEEIEVGE